MFSLLRLLVIVGVIFLILYWAYRLIMSLVPSKNKKKTLNDVDEKIEEAVDNLHELEATVKEDETEAQKTLEESEKIKKEIKKRKEILN